MRQGQGVNAWACISIAFAAMAVAGCRKQPVLLPAPSSAEPAPAEPIGLRAGFGKVDITPPPGVGLMGYGPEGKRARGYRMRLSARALFLEDASGEKLALVTLDLGQFSLLLHRRVAELVHDSTRIGADRLIMSATHTHAGPGHHFAVYAYDEFGSSVAGYDSLMVDFLATHIAEAVLEAYGELQPAKAAWGTRALWGVTRNRSETAFDANPKLWTDRFKPPLIPRNVPGKIDSTLAMLRIDLKDEQSGEYRPAGAFSLFAIHGTGSPSPNELYDADIHGVAARALEEHIDSINGRGRSFRPEAVHLLANGAEGDVSPNLPELTRCQVPELKRVRRPSGHRSPPGPELWIPPPADSRAKCMRVARGQVAFFGDSIGKALVALHGSLKGTLTRDVSLRRSFRTVSLVESSQMPELCAPQPGTATIAGAEDRRTRYHGWALFGTSDVGFEEGGSAALDEPDGCHGHKRRFLGPFQSALAARFPYPEVAQLAVTRIGHVVLGAIPFEATTVAGGRLRAAIASGANRGGGKADTVLLIGLANGYNQYLATEAEYRLQHYEGSSTLYGPKTLAYVERLLEELAADLPAPIRASPPVHVRPVTMYRGPERDIFPPQDAGPAAHRITRSATASWQGDTLYVRWNDLHPGRLIPADGPLLRIERLTGSAWKAVSWDDDPQLEIWAIEEAGDLGYRWEARWSPPVPTPGRYRAVLVRRGPEIPRRTPEAAFPP